MDSIGTIVDLVDYTIPHVDFYYHFGKGVTIGLLFVYFDLSDDLF